MKTLAEETAKEIARLKQGTKMLEEKTSLEVKQKDTEVAILQENVRKAEEEPNNRKQQDEEIAKLMKIKEVHTEKIDQLTEELAQTKTREQRACSNINENISFTNFSIRA